MRKKRKKTLQVEIECGKAEVVLWSRNKSHGYTVIGKPIFAARVTTTPLPALFTGNKPTHCDFIDL